MATLRLSLYSYLCVFLALVSCTQPVSKENISTPTLAAQGSGLVDAPEKIKIGIVVFLSGSAAEPFGIPARNGAEVMIAALNSGGAPAPYDTPGIANVPIVATYVDEAGGAEKQVQELQRLFVEEQVDLVIGYISSSDCLAAAPVAEELQKLLVVFDCGTSRLFEEREYDYVFRTNAHQAIDSIAGARYLLATRPGIVSIAGINQNYAWGQDSWSHFRDTMSILRPGMMVFSQQFPKLGASDYSAEIAALMEARPEVIHTSLWGADLKGLVMQSGSKGLFVHSALLMSVGEYALPELGAHIPAGTMIGAHGTHGALAPQNEWNTWLMEIYKNRYGQRPTYPVYHMAQAILGVKMAYEKSLEGQTVWPSTERLMSAFEYLSYPTPSGMIKLAIGKGHQAVEDAVYATAGEFDAVSGEVVLKKKIIYPPECVNPPEGTTTEQWIKDGFPGNTCP